jgi:hypothetical protein
MVLAAAAGNTIVNCLALQALNKKTDMSTSTTLALTALQIALDSEGVSEQPKGSNDGPEVRKYLRAVGLPAGNPWCMAFVYWAVNEAATKMQKQNPLIKTGHVLTQWNNTTLRKLPKVSKAVQPGDIFIMSFGNGTGHTGIVVSIAGNMVHTIEGNTNDDGSREGYEVAIRSRPISSMLGFIQLN